MTEKPKRKRLTDFVTDFVRATVDTAPTKEQTMMAEDAYGAIREMVKAKQTTAATDLEHKLSETLRVWTVEHFDGKAGDETDEPVVSTLTALTMFNARASLALAGVVQDCGHDDCARERARAFVLATHIHAMQLTKTAIRAPRKKPDGCSVH